MKIKEVCRQTGLSERTVRFYVEQGLLRPRTYELNGRNYLDFSEADVEALGHVAVLRKAGFSIAQIQQMSGNPRAIMACVRELRQALGEQLQLTQHFEQALGALREEDLTSLAALSSGLQSYAEEKELPQMDVEPNFGRFDLLSQEEKARAYENFVNGSARRERARTVTWLICGAILLVALTVWITLSAAGVIGSEPEAPLRYSDEILEPVSEAAFADELSGIRALLIDPVGFTFETAGQSGSDGRLTSVYSDGDRQIRVSGRIFSESENIMMEQAGLQTDVLLNSSGPYIAQYELNLRTEDGGYCAIYIESTDLDPEALLAAIANGLTVYLPGQAPLVFVP